MRPTLPTGMPMMGMPMGMGMPMMGMSMMGMPMMGLPMQMVGMPMMGMPMMGLPTMTLPGQPQIPGPVPGSAPKAVMPGPVPPPASSGGSAVSKASRPPAAQPSNTKPNASLLQKESLLQDLQKAAVTLAQQREAKADRSRSRDRSRSKEGRKKEEAKSSAREKSPHRCHLHPVKKPNAKCKFCQRAQEAATQKTSSESKANDSSKDKREDKDADQSAASTSRGSKKVTPAEEEEEDYSQRKFNCSPMLKDQILGSSYFKSLLQISTMEELIEEIAKYADTIDVYNSGHTVMPSCFICQVYRLFTLPHAEDMNEVQAVLMHPKSAAVRCAGLLYLRMVVPPPKLFEKFEEYLFDEMPLKYPEGSRTVTTTIGEFVEGLINKDKYFSSPLPRIPVKVKQALEKELAPMVHYRKRMQAHARNNLKKISGMPVEVWHDGTWMRGTAKAFAGKIVSTRKVKVELDDGEEVCVHMGKVVLRDQEENEKSKEDEKAGDSEDEKSGSGDEGKKKKKKRSKRSRSRSRSRRRAKSASPDWSRYKCHEGDDLVEAFREKIKDEAVCSYGKSSSKRPLTMEEELWKRHGDSRGVSMLGQEASSGERRRASEKELEASLAETRAKLRREEEEEHKRRMRDIYEKYGSTKSAAYGPGGTRREIDQPDILRLG